jgi:hypothetical protein
MLNPVEYAFDKANNERVQIISASEVWGFAPYKVYNPISTRKHSKTQLNHIAVIVRSDIYVSGTIL